MNQKHVVINVTCNTYVKSYDRKGLSETSRVLEAKRYKNFKKAAGVALKLSDEDCTYKAVELN